MTLMINGKKVLGYAIGGTGFYSIDKNADGSITYNGQNYFSTNKMNIRVTDSFYLGILSSTILEFNGGPLLAYRGYLAILKLSQSGGPDVIARPISIPTTTTTNSLSFYDSRWSGSLSMTTDDTLKLTVSYSERDPYLFASNVNGKFYILSNDAR